ncbi:MAG: helix-turn-helix transcriptional regulator [Acidobacteriaceae bacterium]|nr:helix-turn-helix transcriptional regulator [Acidobacteriaceae bacterium]
MELSEATVQLLANRLRELRQQRSMTLQDVAEKAGFSKGLLSKIETGVVSPPIATLAKLADALHVPIGELFDGPEQDDAVVFFPKESRQDFQGRLSSFNYKYELLLRGRKRRDMQPMVVSVDGRTSKSKLLDHSGEQFIYMLEGEMDYIVGDKLFTVRPDDCLYFDARQLHGPKLKKTQRARYLVVFSNR